CPIYDHARVLRARGRSGREAAMDLPGPGDTSDPAVAAVPVTTWGRSRGHEDTKTGGADRDTRDWLWVRRRRRGAGQRDQLELQGHYGESPRDLSGPGGRPRR